MGLGPGDAAEVRAADLHSPPGWDCERGTHPEQAAERISLAGRQSHPGARAGNERLLRGGFDNFGQGCAHAADPRDGAGRVLSASERVRSLREPEVRVVSAGDRTGMGRAASRMGGFSEGSIGARPRRLENISVDRKFLARYDGGRRSSGNLG